MVLLFDVLTSPGPELLKLGPFSLRWYGLLIAISVLIGVNLSNLLASKKGLNNGIVNDLLPLLVFNSILGARIYYVAFEWRNYTGSNFWSQINIFNFQLKVPSAIEIWGGGIAIHGALIAGIITVIFFCRLRNIQFWVLLDVLLPSVALGQSIGRWGNFFNNEAFGIPTNLPWKLFIPYEYRPVIFSSEEFFHPTFLYESIWNIILFFILMILFNLSLKRSVLLKDGFVSCIYISIYSVGRIWIESLRIDPLCLGGLPPFCEGGIRMAQLISLVLATVGIIGLLRIYILKKALPELGKNRRRVK